MSEWQTDIKKGFTCTKPIFIEGLLGIGNVGKITVDYLILQLKAKKVGTFFSYDLPNSVLVTEDNLVTLPTINLYYYKKGKQDFLFLASDVQPTSEQASFTLAQEIMKLLITFQTKEIITLGGIGLEESPLKNQIYITGNNKKYIETFSGVNRAIYGMVGPIFGITGLLLGFAKNIPAVALLCETVADPFHIGIDEAKQLLKLLEKRFSFSLQYTDLEEEITLLNKEATKENQPLLSTHLGKLKKVQDINYIG